MADHGIEISRDFESAGRGVIFEIDADVEASRHRRLNDGELFGLPDAHVRLLRGQLDLAVNFMEERDEFVVDRLQSLLLARVLNGDQVIASGEWGIGRTQSREGDLIGIAVRDAMLPFQELHHFPVLGKFFASNEPALFAKTLSRFFGKLFKYRFSHFFGAFRHFLSELV